MKHPVIFVSLLSIIAIALSSCDDDADTPPNMQRTIEGLTWSESDADQGELSGDTMSPTEVTLSVGNNIIIGTSVPNSEERCIDNPDGSKTPYYPGHETYTDVITFTLPEDQQLTNIMIEELTVEAVHEACGIPLDMQLGAFTALAATSRIDWNSDTFENFVKLPEMYPLVGAGFAKNQGSDLLSLYRSGFGFGPYAIDPIAELPSGGTYTFWWKEGANRTAYRLNFIVTER